MVGRFARSVRVKSVPDAFRAKMLTSSDPLFEDSLYARLNGRAGRVGDSTQVVLDDAKSDDKTFDA